MQTRVLVACAAFLLLGLTATVTASEASQSRSLLESKSIDGLKVTLPGAMQLKYPETSSVVNIQSELSGSMSTQAGLRYEWYQLSGPPVNPEKTIPQFLSDRSTLTLFNLGVGKYVFECDVIYGVDENGKNKAVFDQITVDVSSMQIASVDTTTVNARSSAPGGSVAKSEIAIPFSYTPVRFVNQASENLAATYLWAQTPGFSAPALIASPAAATTYVSRLGIGKYEFTREVSGELNTAIHLVVEPEPRASVAVTVVTVVVVVCVALSLLGTVLGSRSGWTMGVVSLLQLLAYFAFLRIDFPDYFVTFVRGIRWAICNIAVPWPKVQSPIFPFPRTPSADLVWMEGQTPRDMELYDGNIWVSLFLFVAVALAHFVLYGAWRAFTDTRRSPTPAYVASRQAEGAALVFIYAGLVLNVAFAVTELVSFRQRLGGFSAKLAVLVVVWILLALFVLVYPLAFLGRFTSGIGGHRLAVFEQAHRAFASPKKESLLPFGGPRSDSFGFDAEKQAAFEGGWLPKDTSSGRDFFAKNYLFFESFTSSGYLYIPVLLIEKALLAATLAFLARPVGPASAGVVQAAVILTIVALRALYTVLGGVFADTVERIFVSIGNVCEVAMVALVLVYARGGTSYFDAAFGALVLAGIAAFFYLLDCLRNFWAGFSRSCLPKRAPAPQKREAPVRVPVADMPRALRPEELANFVFSHTVELPSLHRQFNVFVPRSSEMMPFRDRFARHNDVLSMGYAMDADATAGYLFLWAAPEKARVLETDEGKRAAVALLNARKGESQRPGAITRGVGMRVFDSPDFTLVASREEFFGYFGRFVEYPVQDYARKVCAGADGMYEEGKWRGQNAEVVGFECDLEVAPLHYGACRIAASLDRGLNVARQATPNFLRTFDFVTLKSGVIAENGAERVRVVAVVETTDYQLHDFVKMHPLQNRPDVVEEMMRGICLQVVTAINAAQSVSFNGATFDFRHNDLSPMNLSVCLSSGFARRLEEARMRAPGNDYADYSSDPAEKRFLYYNVCSGVAGGGYYTATAQRSFVVDLHRAPLVKIGGFAASSSRVLKADGELSADIIRGHQAPARLPSSSYDLRYFAASMYRLLERHRMTIGQPPQALLSFLDEVASPLRIADLAAGAAVPDAPGPSPAALLDHPFFAPLRADSPARVGPPPTLANTYYFCEHPVDPVPGGAVQ
eukprot:tig00000663_g2994.t1